MSLDNLTFDKKDSWTNYPKGVIKFLQEAGHKIDSGFELYVNGNIPNGSGLSSSASLELLVGIVAEELFDLEVERLDLVKIGKQTENKFIGVNSGIMDQFAIGMGVDKQAIYLDTNTLEYELVPLDLGDNVIVIMNTNKRRELADSKYNERRAECEKAVEELNQVLDIKTLGELDLQSFDEYSYLIKDEMTEPNELPYKKRNYRLSERGKRIILVIVSAAALIAGCVCLICDYFTSDRLSWSLIAAVSIIAAWLMMLPSLISRTKIVLKTLVVVSAVPIPLLAILSLLLNKSVIFTLGICVTLIAIAAIWIIYGIFCTCAKNCGGHLVLPFWF